MYKLETGERRDLVYRTWRYPHANGGQALAEASTLWRTSLLPSPGLCCSLRTFFSALLPSLLSSSPLSYEDQIQRDASKRCNLLFICLSSSSVSLDRPGNPGHRSRGPGEARVVSTINLLTEGKRALTHSGACETEADVDPSMSGGKSIWRPAERLAGR